MLDRVLEINAIFLLEILRLGMLLGEGPARGEGRRRRGRGDVTCRVRGYRYFQMGLRDKVLFHCCGVRLILSEADRACP